MIGFDAAKVMHDNVSFLREWFLKHSDKRGLSKAVIGISGGKDSTIAATLLMEALGYDRVIGVLMPNGKQVDIDDARRVCDILKIHNITINIEDVYNAEIETFKKTGIKLTDQLIINLAPRIRMMTLYAVAQSQDVPAFAINTCNRSEDYVGYSTKYGDSAGDIAILQDLLVSEVIAIGDELGLPYELVHKIPSDGLCGKTDEDNLGFTYADLDSYIIWNDLGKTGKCPISLELADKINAKHEANLHKLKPMPSFIYGE